MHPLNCRQNIHLIDSFFIGVSEVLGEGRTRRNRRIKSEESRGPEQELPEVPARFTLTFQRSSDLLQVSRALETSCQHALRYSSHVFQPSCTFHHPLCRIVTESNLFHSSSLPFIISKKIKILYFLNLRHG
jgi:hypothetical protein